VRVVVGLVVGGRGALETVGEREGAGGRGNLQLSRGWMEGWVWVLSVRRGGSRGRGQLHAS
jgi:hypothetical protein